MTFVIPTASPRGTQIAVPGADLEWAPFSVPGDAPSYTRMLGRLRSASVKRGRPRELDKFAAGALDCELDNADRALDPNYTAGPWWGGVEPERQIRLGLRYGGVYYPRIAAFIDGYPQLWDQSALDATVAVSATDIFKMLAQAPLPSSMYEMAVAIDSPTHQYQLDETGTVAFDSTLSATPVNGTYIATTPGDAGIVPFDGGRTCVSFLHSSLNRVDIPTSLVTKYPFTLEGWIKVPPAGGSLLTVFWQGTPNFSGYVSFELSIFATLVFRVTDGTNQRQVVGPVVGDDVAHHIVAVAADASTFLLYVDGVAVSLSTTTVGTGTPAVVSTNCALGGFPDGSGAFGLGGSLAQFGAYDGVALPAARVLEHYNAGANAFRGSATGTQMSRVLDFLGLPNALRSIQSGNSTIGGSDLPGGKALDYLQALADTEQGQFYPGQSGILTNRQRSDLLTATRSTVSQATYGDSGFPFHVVTANTTAASTALAGISPVLTAADVGALVVGPGIPAGTTIAAQAGATATLSAQATMTQTGATLNLGEIPYTELIPAFDETRVWNDVTFDRQDGAPQRVIDPVSRRKYGVQGFPAKTLLYADDNQSLDMANWTLAHNANAVQRFIAATFELIDPVVITNVLPREIGDRVTVVERPSKLGSPIQQDVIIEGVADKVGPPATPTVTFQLSAAEAQQYWVLGDNQLSVLGSTTRVAA